MCWEFSKKYIIYTFLIQFFALVKSILILFLPRAILDAVFTTSNINSAIYYLVLLLSSTLVLGLINGWLTKKQFTERMVAFKGFQTHLGKIMMNAPLSTLESNEFLNVKSRAEQYLYGGGNGFGTVVESAFSLIGKMLTVLFYAIVIAQLNIWVLLLVILILILNFVYNFKFQKKNILINMEKSEQERRNKYFSDIFQDFSYGKEIRVFNISQWLTKKYDTQLQDMLVFYKKLGKNSFLYTSFALVLSVVQQTISYGYLMVAAFQQKITVGDFSMYLTAISTFSTSLTDVVSGVITLQQYSDYYAAYKQYISIPSIFQKGNISLPEISQNMVIRFENVSFRYQHSDSYALYNVTTTIFKNDKISIVGKNGAGKSTFIKLLLRIYEPTEGTIYLNDVDIQTIEYKQYLRLFSTVFQDFKLLALSVAENIAMQEVDDIARKKIDESVQEFSTLYAKLNSFQNGIDVQMYKIFDNNGYTPSGGEAQKLAIVRAVFKDAPIIILDEPSSALDPEAEHSLIQKFSELTLGKTSIFVSHRLSSAKSSTKILVFEEGRLCEEGTHDELVELQGLYYNLFSLQSSYY